MSKQELAALLDQDREAICKVQLAKLLRASIALSRPLATSSPHTCHISMRYLHAEAKIELPMVSAGFDAVLNHACMLFAGDPQLCMLAELDPKHGRLLLPKNWTAHGDGSGKSKWNMELVPKLINNGGGGSGKRLVDSPAKQLGRKLRRSTRSGGRRAGTSAGSKREVEEKQDLGTTREDEDKGPQEVRYIWCELVLHALVFVLLAVGLWVNSAQVRAEYWKQTLNAQLTQPFSPQRVQFGQNLSNNVQLWEWMNGGPLTQLLLFPDVGNSSLESTCLPHIPAQASTTTALECEFSIPAQSPWLAQPGLLLVVDSGVVFRQYRVAINTCGSPRFFPCFGSFSSQTMETRRFGPALTNSPNSDCGFTWTNPRQTQALISMRSGTRLEQSGYVFTVLDYQQLLPGLNYLEANNWTDAATRAITVQFVLQTASAGGNELLAVQLLIEINEIGNVFTSVQYYSNTLISTTRLITNILTLLIELVILLVAMAWLKANLALDGVVHTWAWLAKLWDILFVLLFIASFGLDAALFASTPGTGEGFAQVQYTDALMLAANRFRYVLITMQTYLIWYYVGQG
ncbi:hypothetical protein BASA81_010024 [Batrachochytrium salamandrivorans]|nr:hypothetical protein BASA81_010024 [Batrachochytrium salamandrivorans]